MEINKKILQKSDYLYPCVKQPFYKKLIRGLYQNFVNDLYIPSGKQSICITREPKIAWGKNNEKKGKIKSVRITVNGQENYFFKEFTEILEDKNGL